MLFPMLQVLRVSQFLSLLFNKKKKKAANVNRALMRKAETNFVVPGFFGNCSETIRKQTSICMTNLLVVFLVEI